MALTDLILACISSSSISVMWNGKTSDPLPHQKELDRKILYHPIFLSFAWITSLLDWIFLFTQSLKPSRAKRRSLTLNHVFLCRWYFSFCSCHSSTMYILFFQISLNSSFPKTLLHKHNNPLHPTPYHIISSRGLIETVE